MKHIRGEKVIFEKGDYRHLDAMPSACHEDAAVLSMPRRKSWTRRCIKLGVMLALLVVIGLGSLFIALEEGYLDKTLTSQAESALSSALGDKFEPEVGSVRLRFMQNWMLAIAAVDVKITHVKSGVVALKTDSIAAILDPVALLRGRVVLARAEIGRAEGDLRFLPAAPPLDWQTVRIDSVPDLLAAFYPELDKGVAALQRAGTREIVIGSVAMQLSDATEPGDKVELAGLDFLQMRGGHYMLTTTIRHGKLTPRMTASMETEDGKVQSLHVGLAGIAAEPILLKYSHVTGERRMGLDLPLDIDVTAERDRNLILKVNAGEGLFYADGDAQPVKSGKALLAYDFKDKKFEMSDGLLDFGATVIPLEGTAIDLDRVEPGKPAGFAFQVIGNDAVASAEGSNEAPEHFNANVKGYFLPGTHELRLDTIGISTEQGNFAGSLDVRFVQPSPAINFAARADSLSVASVKQIWPFWFGKKARHWVLTHMTGGMVRNAAIDVSLAAGRIPDHPEPLIFRKGEMHIAFDAEDTSVKFIEEMPGARKAAGHFEMQDRNLKIDIKQGEIPLPSGKVLTGKDGSFEIADISAHPLMATLTMNAAGDASAVAEFANYPPLNAMARAPFTAAGLTGAVAGSVNATFGLEKDENPPKPVFKVALDLNNVSIGEPVQDRKIANILGTLAIDSSSAVLKGKADVDGMGFDVTFVEPLAKDNKDGRQWHLQGKVSDEQIAKAAPSLSAFVSGNVGIDIQNSGDKSQKAKIDLTSTGLSLPVVGWRKGAGIPATAEFTLVTNDNGTEVRDLVFDGDGFGAKGSMMLDSRGLVSAKFSRVQLSSSDNFSLSVARKSSGHAIEVSGESIDMRPFLDRVKSPTSSDSAAGRSKSSDTVTATIGRATGYNKESLSAVILRLATSKGAIATVNFSAVTRSGEAVVVKRDGADGVIGITAGDAGAVARFTDFYSKMNGGLLNISLKARDENSWRGSIDIRNFALVNEQRLKSIVSARTGSDGRSLSEAVNSDIDVSSQKFRRGFARVLLDGKRVAVENGIVRGDEVGATFQGVVRDGNGRMDMTGTFMPAYGLNSLFSQLPLIGSILGNGRDRGLLGITFKLVGPFDTPRLTVNPLSLIAPGVFRNIFEFE